MGSQENLSFGILHQADDHIFHEPFAMSVNGQGFLYQKKQCCTGTRSAFRRSGTSSEFCGTSLELVPIWKWPERNGTTFFGLKLVPFRNWSSTYFCRYFSSLPGFFSQFINQWCVICKYLELVPDFFAVALLKVICKTLRTVYDWPCIGWKSLSWANIYWFPI